MKNPKIVLFLLAFVPFLSFCNCGPNENTESTDEKRTESSLEQRTEKTSDTQDAGPKEDDTDQTPDGACINGTTQPCYSGPANTKGVGLCRAGIMKCNNGTWSACEKEVTPAQDDPCDGKDNDCDRKVDEDCECKNGQKQGCYTASTGCKKAGDSFQCTSPCQIGQQTCSNNAWGTCEGAVEPQKEICDGKDNDCNGKTDEDFPDKGKRCDSGQKGECQEGAWTCVSGKKTCTPKHKATQEICNGKDDDCDGKVDNALPTRLCKLQKGVCKGSTQRCAGSSGWQACSSFEYKSHSSAYETKETKCDGKDNNCNGQTDETFADKGQACSSTQKGECKPGIWTCTSGTRACTPNHQPKTESCNGKDDDCDGKVDNNLTAPLCANQKGVCAGSKKICAGAAGWKACTAAEYGSLYETKESKCNGKDDDCDGKVDNGLTAPLCANQKGVCAGSKKICAGAAGWKACTAAEYGSLYETKESKCDGKDNDCNGKVDIGCVTTYAGSPGSSGLQDGARLTAKFKLPTAISFHSGALYIADTDNNVIRKIDLTSGTVSTLSGGTYDSPQGLTWDGSGNLLIADTKNHIIKKRTASGTVSDYAGKSGSSGTQGGTGSQARFNFPTGLATHSNGTFFYIADTKNHMLRDISGAASVFWLAGKAGSFGDQDGSARTQARFESPQAIVFHAGALYIADTGNNKIKKLVLATGIVSTLPGTYKNPQGLAFSPSGDLYITDTKNHCIKKLVLSTGQVTIVAGSTRSSSGRLDGMTTSARFSEPKGLAFDPAGQLYVVDSDNHTIRKIILK